MGGWGPASPAAQAGGKGLPGPPGSWEPPRVLSLPCSSGSIVCVGGDGMFSEVLHGLVGRTQRDAGVDQNQPRATLVPSPLRIGIIPAGTWADVGLCPLGAGAGRLCPLGEVGWRGLSTGGWGGRNLPTGGWGGWNLPTGQGLGVQVCPLGAPGCWRLSTMKGPDVRLCPLGRAGCPGSGSAHQVQAGRVARGCAFRSISGVLFSPRTWRGPTAARGKGSCPPPWAPGSHQVVAVVCALREPAVGGGWAAGALSTVEETGSPESRQPGRSNWCLEPGLGGGPRGVRGLACPELAGSACSMTQGSTSFFQGTHCSQGVGGEAGALCTSNREGTPSLPLSEPQRGGPWWVRLGCEWCRRSIF